MVTILILNKFTSQNLYVFLVSYFHRLYAMLLPSAINDTLSTPITQDFDHCIYVDKTFWDRPQIVKI